MDVITTHINADFDCLGSMIGARKLYPDAVMVFAGSQERSLREFFVKSAYYAYDFKRVRDVDLERIDRLILVDVRQSSRIGPFAAVARRSGVEVHIYDHHPSGDSDLRGDLEVIEPVGATVTVLTQLFMQRRIRPTPDEATMMMLGLYEDTGSLLFSSTTDKDYQAAAYLLGCGANLNTVADFLTQEMTADQVALLHELITSRTVLNVNGIEISLAHASVEEFVGDLAVLAHKLKDMENLDALIVAVRMGERIFLVGRSRLPEVHVGEILGELGGGGHRYAASGTVRDLTLVQVLDRLPIILRRHVTPRWEARHLMTAPVKTVAPSAPIGEVRQLLTRYNINALPVLEAGKVVGLISRKEAERAAHHGLGELPVREYMSGEFSVVTPTTAIEVLQELIVERNQRFVPVVDDGLLVGAITRTDLLRHLVSGGRGASRAPQATVEGGPMVKKRHMVRMLRDRLPATVVAILQQMGSVGEDLGVSVFAVGGFVRDLLLGQANLDIDIVIEGDGIAFAQAFARQHPCRVRAHHKFGTAVLVFPDGFKVDIASARMEYYLAPGALPMVEHASIRLDLYRRDFTINTLAVALNGRHYGDVLDYFGAQRDLQEKAIRVLHNLSFVEDPTRVFRAIRFEQRLGFHLGKHSEYLLRSAVRMGFVDRVGGPRLFNELVIILKESDPRPALVRMAELDLLKYLHPTLGFDTKAGAQFEAASRAIHWYELLYTGQPCERWLVYFLCLTAALDADAVAGMTARLSIPGRYHALLGEQREDGRALLRKFERRRDRNNNPLPSEIRAWLHPLGTELRLALMALSESDAVKRWISLYFTQLREVAPLLDGKDLAALGLAPGPAYKEVRQALLDARLNGKVVTREEEEQLVRKRFLRPGRKSSPGN